MVGDILQPTHLLLILVVALFVLGPKRLPEVGRTLGNGLRDFRSAINGEPSERREDHDEAPMRIEPEPDDHQDPVAEAPTPESHDLVDSEPAVSAHAPEPLVAAPAARSGQVTHAPPASPERYLVHADAATADPHETSEPAEPRASRDA